MPPAKREPEEDDASTVEEISSVEVAGNDGSGDEHAGNPEHQPTHEAADPEQAFDDFVGDDHGGYEAAQYEQHAQGPVQEGRAGAMVGGGIHPAYGSYFSVTITSAIWKVTYRLRLGSCPREQQYVRIATAGLVR